MDIECVNGEIVMTLSSGNVIKCNRKYYTDFIDSEYRILKTVQSNIDEAEKMIALIDNAATPKTTD